MAAEEETTQRLKKQRLELSEPKILAPYMHEYYILRETRILEMFEEEKRAAEKGEYCKKVFAKKYSTIAEQEFTPLLLKSFRRHDTNHNGKLEKEEAFQLFSNCVAEVAGFSKFVMMLFLEQSVLNTLPEISAEEDAGKRSEMLRELDLKAREETDRSLAGYRANTAECNAKALVALDTDGDGSIQYEEFLAAFLMADKSDDGDIQYGLRDNEISRNFRLAVGLNPISAQLKIAAQF
jgi:Ca2+-binding EF-hand superfamily protein